MLRLDFVIEVSGNEERNGQSTAIYTPLRSGGDVFGTDTAPATEKTSRTTNNNDDDKNNNNNRNGSNNKNEAAFCANLQLNSYDLESEVKHVLSQSKVKYPVTGIIDNTPNTSCDSHVRPDNTCPSQADYATASPQLSPLVWKESPIHASQRGVPRVKLIEFSPSQQPAKNPELEEELRMVRETRAKTSKSPHCHHK